MQKNDATAAIASAQLGDIGTRKVTACDIGRPREAKTMGHPLIQSPYISLSSNSALPTPPQKCIKKIDMPSQRNCDRSEHGVPWQRESKKQALVNHDELNQAIKQYAEPKNCIIQLRVSSQILERCIANLTHKERKKIKKKNLFALWTSFFRGLVLLGRPGLLRFFGIWGIYN